MEKSTKLHSLLLITVAIISSANAALVIVPNDTGTELANSILAPDISLVSGSVSYSGATSGSSGFFSGGVSAGISLESGLILTTGVAAYAVGPNDSDNTTGPGTTTSLNFSFTTLGGDLYFNYVFASDEYFPSFVSTNFNDTFRFTLDGVNIALLPGNTPVEINTINIGSNSTLYNDNSLDQYNIEYNGFSDVLTTKVLGLSAGTHTISLTISDGFDASIDSAVFIQAGSITKTPPGATVPDGGTTIALLGTALLGLVGIRRKLR